MLQSTFWNEIMYSAELEYKQSDAYSTLDLKLFHFLKSSCVSGPGKEAGTVNFGINNELRCYCWRIASESGRHRSQTVTGTRRNSNLMTKSSWRADHRKSPSNYCLWVRYQFNLRINSYRNHENQFNLFYQHFLPPHNQPGWRSTKRIL